MTEQTDAIIKNRRGPKNPNLVGQKFGLLTVESPAGHKKNRLLWNCRCDCGRIIQRCTGDLTRKAKLAKSCGCALLRELSQYTGQLWNDPQWVARVLAARNRPILEKIAEGQAECLRCHTAKPLEDFPKGHKRRDGTPRYAYCKPCHCEYQRILRLARTFNLTEADYETLARFQNGCCAICGRPAQDRNLAVDHDHKTGLIRGLLCWLCNRLLGIYRDNTETLSRAVAYLQTPPATVALGAPRYGLPGCVDTKKQQKLLSRAEKLNYFILPKTVSGTQTANNSSQ